MEFDPIHLQVGGGNGAVLDLISPTTLNKVITHRMASIKCKLTPKFPLKADLRYLATRINYAVTFISLRTIISNL